jgi:hypothetical protein
MCVVKLKTISRKCTSEFKISIFFNLEKKLLFSGLRENCILSVILCPVADITENSALSLTPVGAFMFQNLKVCVCVERGYFCQ